MTLKETILKEALEIFKQQGLEGITAGRMMQLCIFPRLLSGSCLKT